MSYLLRVLAVLVVLLLYFLIAPSAHTSVAKLKQTMNFAYLRLEATYFAQPNQIIAYCSFCGCYCLY